MTRGSGRIVVFAASCSILCPTERTEHHFRKVLSMQLLYFSITFHRYTSWLTFLSYCSPPVLLSHCWSPHLSCEVWGLAETQPPSWPSLALDLHLALSTSQELLHESTPVQTWKKSSFCPSALFSSSGTSLKKLWDLQHRLEPVWRHRQQRAHLDKCCWRDCGFGLQRKAGTKLHALHRSYLCLLLIPFL